MAKAKKPVSIAGIEFDALISSDRSMEATVPEYTTESGFTVSDAIILNEETLSLVLYLTETPVTWSGRKDHGSGHVETVISKLEELYYKREPVKVITSEKTYKNMAIEQLGISKSLEIGYAKEISVSLRQVRTTKTKTTTIPKGYGKSGSTKKSSGTAGTSSGGSSGGSSGSSSGGKSGSSSGGSSGSSGGKQGSQSGGSSGGSILYNIGKKTGLIK